MPGLVLFNRRWTVSSDDFVFSSAGEAVLRIAWLLTLIIILSIHHDDFECSYGHTLRFFYIGTLVLNVLGLISSLILLYISMQGSIKNAYPRRHVCKCLYAKLLLFLPEFVWVCLSTFWAFGHSYICDYSVVVTARAAVIFSWLVCGLVMFSVLMAFDPVGSAKSRSAVTCRVSGQGDESLSVSNVSASKVWENRCRCMCCCISFSQDTREAFSDVAKLVADFFHDLDLVPSDIVAGLVLVQQDQVEQDDQLNTVTVGSSSNGPSLPVFNNGAAVPQPKSWMTIDNMNHFFRYAMGSYGWPFFMYQHLTTGLCRLSTKFRCCACIRKSNSVLRDNICQCNTAAIKKLSGIAEEDIVYVTFHNKFKQIPFYVVLDREKNAVVVSIRGTLSLQDALTDIWAVGAPLDIPGVEESFCHSAMLDCAKYIESELKSLKLLDTAFSYLQQGASLVVTGHSLGAGVAALLAVLLRQEYPNLMCFSYSPPGGLMSPKASKYALDFVCSVVVGKDLVPRLGMSTLADLKVKILKALNECHYPKYRILATGCSRLVCGKRSSSKDRSSQLLIRDKPLTRYMEERPTVLQEALRMAENQASEVMKTNWPLHPAGQILHIFEVEESSICGQEAQYAAVWCDPQVFNKIVISHKMVSDHIPNAVAAALEQLVEKKYVPQQQQTAQLTHHC
ncbi:diacylglycerol lipase-beta isoform X2 [Aplysia californica]|uniref:sn-1-specific diacylglycerol lipase n=1 Tax=Aplysia californica TaxID=6500 RepID=A0ABM0JY74_APLCA|nr:diacylglycerol lipase-beta isoform X2 [Aplysia californica]